MTYLVIALLAASPPGGLLVVFFLLVVVAIGFAFWTDHQRRKEMRALAHAHGWRYHAGRDHGMERRFPGFSRLQEGRNRYATNVIEGERNGRRLWAFDYHYTTGSGKHRRQHAFTAVLLEAELRLDPLRIRRENVFDALTAAFGFDDIDFESAEFSRRFHVSSPNKEWAYTVLHPATMAFLLDAPSHPVELHTRHALSYGSSRLAPSRIRDAILVLEGVLDRIPDDVVAARRLTAGVS